MRPEEAEKALIATHGGLSLEWCALLCNISPMSLYRFICSFGRMGLVSVLTRCGLPLPAYLLADEKHSHCLEEKVYLPTIVSGRIIWHLGYAEDKSAEAFEASYQQFKEAALAVDPDYRPRGILTDGFESTRKSMRRLFQGVPLGNCLMHATKKVAAKLQSIATSLRESLKAEFFKLFEQARTRKGLKVFSFGQKLRHFVEKVSRLAGASNAERIREWITDKKEGWYAVLAHRHMPPTSTLLDQAHNAIDRKLFMMKGFHHPQGSQSEFIIGLALLYNLVPYQRRAKNAGRCGIEVEGGKVPTKDWFLNLRILTAGGFQ